MDNIDEIVMEVATHLTHRHGQFTYNAFAKALLARLSAADAEPVGYMDDDGVVWNNVTHPQNYKPLFLHPPLTQRSDNEQPRSVPEDVERDAQRYRWMCEHGLWECPNCVSEYKCNGPHWYGQGKDFLDKEIDVLIAEDNSPVPDWSEHGFAAPKEPEEHQPLKAANKEDQKVYDSIATNFFLPELEEHKPEWGSMEYVSELLKEGEK